jgi:DNA polymerase-3 subunit epsilon
VAQRLEDGPVHTLALAREILRLEGHPGAASAAIFTLIGGDARFAVDAGGMWSLKGAPPGRSLSELSFAVVDVETTGGRPAGGDRITEIAIVEVRDGAVVDEYQSLVNPGRTIPPMVQRLTGITGGMVGSAPYFEHVAPEVARRLEGRVFVAHNVGFDHAFVNHELQQALGEAPRAPTLCTVRLARGLLPRLRRRNLDALAQHYGISIHARHRAHGDALATARILIRMLDEAGRQGVHDLESLRSTVRRRNRRRGRRSPQRSLWEDEPGSNASPGSHHPPDPVQEDDS